MSKQSDALRDYFEKMGILQKDVCKATGMSVGTLSNILSGRFQISKNAARKFNEAYGFSIPFLITGDGDLVPPGGIHIRRVDHVQNSGTINQGDGDLEALVAQLTEQLARERAEKERLLKIVERMSEK